MKAIVSVDQTAASVSGLGDRRLVRMVGLIVVAFLIGGGLWLLRWCGGTAAATPDTFWYARDALRHAGYSQSAADTGAAKITCGAMSRARHSRNYNGCLNYRLQLPATAPVRFQRIFTSRPGYPLLTTPFVWAIGGAGFIVGTALLGIACGVAIVLLGLVAGLRPSQALLAEVVFYLLPTGLWASRLLAEPPMIFFLCVALIGTIILIRGGGRVAGVLTLAIGLACLRAVKPANGVALSAALAAGSVVLLPMHPLASELPRLSVVTWIPVALGIAALAPLPPLKRSTASRSGPETDSVAG